MTLPTPRAARLFAAACALVFLLAHLPFLASTLEDVDSVNFALALRRFDVAAHRPHPPGYPVFVALGKLVHAPVQALSAAGTPRDTTDARTLSIIGVVFAALLAFPLLQVFRMLEEHRTVARAAVVLTLASPLMWVTASRPLSDTAGLFAAAVAQALLFTASRRQRSARDPAGAAEVRDRVAGLVASGRLIVLGAFVAGFAIGMRSQTAWLTVPLLVLVITDRAGRGAAGALLGAAVMFTAGVLLWAIPLLWATGGLHAYVTAVTSQAAEDLTGVDLLARNPTLRRFVLGLGDTFVDPWGSPWLAAIVCLLAVTGAAAMLRRARAALTLLVVSTLPYLTFHLVFQETFTTRYALPMIPVVAYLAARGLAVGGRLPVIAGAAALVAASLSPSVPALAGYAGSGSPVARAVADIREGLARYSPHGRALVMNHPFSIALRDDAFDADRIPSVRRRQWLEIVKYWQSGGTKPVWFLAEPGPNGLDRHHELTLIDPAARILRGSYRWPFDPVTFVGGARPSEADWQEIDAPGWFATEGWALTPEIAGVSRLDRRGPAAGGISAFIRRRSEPAIVLIGGRNLGATGAPDVRFDLTIDGRPMRSWRVPGAPGFFLDLWTLEADQLAGEGPFATMRIEAHPADGGSTPIEAAVEQFDLQPLTSVVAGFGTGWHEEEFSPAQNRLWRWASDEANIRVHAPPGRAIRCVIRGEGTRPYFDKPSRAVLRAGSRVLMEREVDGDYTWDVTVAPDALDDAGGVLTLTTDQTFTPTERTGNGDKRRLGLRVYEVRVTDASQRARDIR